ncbi:uncharacterized protein si:ch211-151h10.2 [Girardinichthys multiradiatus]|uniref:uncharacterized protein si:ch211-151h10.2 n=1 Tax=Girardinichthys multiradiatus TaxID=208333 RepID=UPI001FABC7C6|nr:uncharacterized protein si:ch211-151h10.2 [Girardinichthys multiradiatus]
MEEEREDGAGAAAENQQQQSLIQTQNEGPLKGKLWSQTLRTFCCFVPVAAVWFVCQLEALPHPSLPLEHVCCRVLLVCLLWAVLAAGIYVLRCCLRPGQNQDKPLQRKQQVVKPGNHRNLYSRQLSRMPSTRTPGIEVPLALALTDSLLLCVLQEPLEDPSVSHIEALHSRLEAVAHTLEKVNFGSEVILEEVGQGTRLSGKLNLLCAYLEQRIGSLQALVQVQTDFESSVKDLLQGLDGLWSQLEELHTGVTLTKKDSQGNKDPASTQADAECLVSVLAQYQNKLQSCQDHQKDSTQLLQDLTWSHTHISSKVNSGSESVWPELLLQSNIEEFDKVQESFSSLEQQTATFKTHLQGLGKENQTEPVGALVYTNGADSMVLLDLPLRSSTPLVTKTRSPLSLRERSALKFPSAMGCLPKPGKKK